MVRPVTMKEAAERIIELGFSRNPGKVVDEVELVTADMIRQGWKLIDTLVEEGLGNIHLFFERELPHDNAMERKNGR